MADRDLFTGGGDVTPTGAVDSQTGSSHERLMHDLRTPDGRVIRGVRGDGNQDIALDNGQIVIHNRGKIEIYRSNNGGVDYRNDGQEQYDFRQHIPYARNQGQETRNRFVSTGNDDYGLDTADQEVAAYHQAQYQAQLNQRQFSQMTYPQRWNTSGQFGPYYGQRENGVAQTVDAFGRLLGAVAPIGLAALAMHGRGGVFINTGGYGGWGSQDYGWNQQSYPYSTWGQPIQQTAWNGMPPPAYQTAWGAGSNPNWNYQLALLQQQRLQQQQQQQYWPYPTQFAPPNPGFITNPNGTAYQYQVASGWGVQQPTYGAAPYYAVG